MTGIFLILTSLFSTMALISAAKVMAGSLLLTWTTAAQMAGALGVVGLSWAYILAIRHPVLEELFGGLDKAYKVHHITGGLAFIAVINHPLFLVLAALPANTLSLYLLPSTSLPYTLGVAALYLLGLLILLTLFVDLPYKLWKKTHELTGLVIILGGVHAFLVPSELSGFTPLRYWILLWSAAATAAYIYKRFLYYRFTPKYLYRVVSINRHGDTAVVRLAATEPERHLKMKPGQYAFFSLTGSNPRDEHPFSLLAQTGEYLAIGLKTVGLFTLAFPYLRIGTVIVVRGPFGTFAEKSGRAREMVWIAGGIGVTPFASMAAALRPDQKVTLFYSTRDGGPPLITTAFRKHSEITPGFRWIEHTTASAGHLTAQMLAKLTTISQDTYFFLCGPQPLMESLTSQLATLGVRRRHIIYEDFNLR